MNDDDLPMDIKIKRPEPNQRGARRPWWKIVGLLALIVIVGVLAAPRIVPVLGLPPLASAPMASVPSEEITAPPAPAALPDLETQVAALGRLEPAGGVVELALPSSAADASVLSLAVEAGAEVRAGDLIATLGTQPRMQTALARAEAEIIAQEYEIQRVLYALVQARIDAEASLQIATSRHIEAAQVLSRQERLQEGANVSVAALEEARTDLAIAAAELQQAEAQLARLPEDLTQHPDYLAAVQALALLRLSRDNARLDLEETSLRAPIDGTIIETVVRPGERPGNGGVVRLANLGTMVVRMEIHQNRIHRIQLGDTVIIQGEALAEPLRAEITAIGLEVLDQGIIGTDPVAANNARVFEVLAKLDPASTATAAGLINLQVIATIEVGS
ncbi:MAG: HlyD family efflux transporter periplasmic adaptor subunit [Pseudomonadota bacterium]